MKLHQSCTTGYVKYTVTKKKKKNLSLSKYVFNVIYFISDHDKHLLLAFLSFFLSMADTIMTDNHSTDQNNNKNDKKNVTDNNDEKIESYENGITESMHNGKSKGK